MRETLGRRVSSSVTCYSHSASEHDHWVDTKGPGAALVEFERIVSLTWREWEKSTKNNGFIWLEDLFN